MGGLWPAVLGAGPDLSFPGSLARGGGILLGGTCSLLQASVRKWVLKERMNEWESTHSGHRGHRMAPLLPPVLSLDGTSEGTHSASFWA